MKVARLYTWLRPRDPQSWIVLADVITDEIRLRQLSVVRDGEVMFDSGELRRPEEVLHQGLSRNPDSVDLQLALANIYLFQGDRDVDGDSDRFESAFSLWQQIASDYPTLVQPILGLAELAARRRDYEEVARLAREAERRLSATEDVEQFLRLVSLVALLPGQQRWALDLIQRLEQGPGNRQIGLLRVLLLEEVDPPVAVDLLTALRESWAEGPESFEEELAMQRKVLVDHWSRNEGTSGGPHVQA